jgi:tetratricopeptide (TPR) repeat protein/predicted Ser/Thr protein kinase
MGNGLLINEDVRVLFGELAGRPRGEREEHYARERVSEAARAELESLFAFDKTGGDSIGSLVGSAAEQLLLSGAAAAEGARFGPYRLGRLLGHGGMGAVYLAERADGEIRQHVAIKFLRPGADVPSFRERFLRERQILASLNHPGIARLLDVGHRDGQPYLVMEYIDGTRIDEYTTGLEPRAVVHLILKVAEAVSYAHRNLIIHRDLKPSNILVDAAGQPKLLDFGIARLMDGADETRTVDRVMTPEYASPEQILGAAQATTTDVYSLAAVLRRLLPANGISGDLGAILRKAMREEPEERYISVDLFIADLQALLHHRPVEARRGNAFYLARKFVRRRWLPMAAATLAIGGLTGGLWVANRERALADRRFEQVQKLSNQLLDLDSDIRVLPGSTKARDRIINSSIGYLERLGAEARPSRWSGPSERDLDIALDIGRAYVRVAHVQGVPGYPSLGRFAEARKSLERAESFIEPLLPHTEFRHHRLAQFALAEIAHDRMILSDSENRQKEAMGFAAQAAQRLGTLFPGKTTEEALVASQIYTNLAHFHQNGHRLEEAAGYARRAVDAARRIGHPDRPLSASLGILANTTRFAGDFDTALASIREARAIAEKMPDPSGVGRALSLSAALWREGVLLGELNNVSLERPAEAIPLLRQALDLAEALARKDAADYTSRSYVSMAGRELGDLLRERDPAEALSVYEQTYRRLEEVKHNPKARRDQVWLLTGASYALRRLGRPAEAKARIDAAFVALGQLKTYPATVIRLGDETDSALRALADHAAATGDIPAAIATYQELLEKTLASHPQPQTDLRDANGLSRTYRDLSALHRRLAHEDEAVALDQRRHDIWQYWNRKLPENPFVQRQFTAARMN